MHGGCPLQQGKACHALRSAEVPPVNNEPRPPSRTQAGPLPAQRCTPRPGAHAPAPAKCRPAKGGCDGKRVHGVRGRVRLPSTRPENRLPARTACSSTQHHGPAMPASRQRVPGPHPPPGLVGGGRRAAGQPAATPPTPPTAPAGPATLLSLRDGCHDDFISTWDAFCKVGIGTAPSSAVPCLVPRHPSRMGHGVASGMQLPPPGGEIDFLGLDRGHSRWLQHTAQHTPLQSVGCSLIVK